MYRLSVARRLKTGRAIMALCVWYISPPPISCVICCSKIKNKQRNKTKKQSQIRFRFESPPRTPDRHKTKKWKIMKKKSLAFKISHEILAEAIPRDIPKGLSEEWTRHELVKTKIKITRVQLLLSWCYANRINRNTTKEMQKIRRSVRAYTECRIPKQVQIKRINKRIGP